MIKISKRFGILSTGFFLAIPLLVYAVETGKVLENFSAPGRLDERATSAFLDTAVKQVSLPLRATVRDLGVGLQGLGRSEIGAVAVSADYIMVGGSNGALNIISRGTGTAQNISALIANARRVRGIGFLESQGLWVVAGEAKTGTGAMFYTLDRAGTVARDLQSSAKAADLDRIDQVACGADTCVLIGVKGSSSKQAVRFDGSALVNITGTFALNTAGPWAVSSGPGDIALAGVFKDPTVGAREPFIIRVYRLRAGSWQKITSDELLRSAQEPRINLNFTGSQWVLARRGSGAGFPFRMWTIDETRFSEITPRFGNIGARLTFDPLFAGGAGNFYYIGGQGLFTDLGGALELSNGRLPALAGVKVNALLALEGRILIAGLVRGAPQLLELDLQGFVPSATLTTKKIASAGSGKYFKKATVRSEGVFPSGTGVLYALSPDGGAHFEQFEPDRAREFTSQGEELRLQLTLSTADSQLTPSVKSVTIEFEKDEVETAATLRKHDDRRIADLKNIARALDQFKKDRRVYPIVDGNRPAVRYDQLSALLKEGKYLAAMPTDPEENREADQVYDYISATGGSAYVLRARLEESGSKRFEKDADGQPVEPNLFDYSCDDPWYCEGKGFTVSTAPVEAPPIPRGIEELWRTEDGRVYRVATIGGGATPVERRRLYIPRPSVLRKLIRFYGNMRQVGKAQIEQVPRAKLVKLADKDDLYYITETFLKRRLPSRAVFDSYGNSPREIVTVKQEELEAYGDSRLIRLTGDQKIWYLENGVRRWIPNPTVFRERGFNWKEVAPVNFAEYNSYPEGPPLP
ncbi:hypothetical protein HYW17_00275 [Candidatus Uhrbacteria bacterium]|nr:hypothetical protein [Candidatus Uhrbacteria bacterium]